MPACPRSKTLRLALLTLALFSPQLLLAQIGTGTVAGTLRDTEAPLEGATVVVSSDLGFQATAKTDARGAFLLTLPYGRYELKVQNGRAAPSSIFVTIEPLRNQQLHLMVTASGNLQIEAETSANAGIWAASPDEGYPTAHTFAGLMLDREPATAAQPLNYSGLGDNRLAWQSQGGSSWTGTQFNLLGMDATDSFQPGQPRFFPMWILSTKSSRVPVSPRPLPRLTPARPASSPLTRSRVARRFFHQRHGRRAGIEQSAAARRSRCGPAERAVSLAHPRCRGSRRRARQVGRSIYFVRRPRVLANHSYRRAWK